MEKRNKLKNTLPSDRRTLLMMLLIAIVSASCVMIIAVGITYGLIGDFGVDLMRDIVKLPAYWIVSGLLFLILFCAWLGDFFNRKS
jgi:hypothetical protein